MKTSVPQLLVGGRWLSTAERLPVVNPYTGEEITRVPMGNAETVDLAISAAATAFPKVKNTPAHQRTGQRVLIRAAHQVARTLRRQVRLQR